MKFKLTLFISGLLFLSSISTAETVPKYEFRATWIATVLRLDWPKSSTVSTQKSQLISILDNMQKANFNAAIFQIRPVCDAFYASDIEPWSNWLTGTEGQAPSPYYDPLEFAIEEAHKRGIELHAWFNPYRAKKGSSDGTSADHVFNKHPEWILAVGSKKSSDNRYYALDEQETNDTKGTDYILNPGLAVVREYVLGVIMDVVNRYDVDGVHMDDYFYPYSGITNEDQTTFVEENRGFSNIGDWRRDNVNLLIESIYDSIRIIKPDVKFGMSPFGIWKNGVPDGIVGTSSYSAIYCDPIAWLDGHYIDYLTPQLYWPFGGAQDYG
ncbi:MAG: family 10 glycosylhydrolase, partial [Candidatus Marinimicrobia bacterium]|nr:family 10 glycosylhydrolase [Candidatus Neomarinimicrobiota bacterium]